MMQLFPGGFLSSFYFLIILYFKKFYAILLSFTYDLDIFLVMFYFTILSQLLGLRISFFRVFLSTYFVLQLNKAEFAEK